MNLDLDMDRDAGPNHAESSSSRSRGSNNLMDTSLELALLKCLPYARPIGKHRHFRMIALQGKIRDMTGVALAFEEIWKKLEEYYSLEDLDELASSSASYPSSPRSLSPLPRPARGYGHHVGPLYSEDDMDIPSRRPTTRELEARHRQSSSESLSPAPELPTGATDSDTGRKGKKKGRLSDLPDNEKSRTNGFGSTRGRRANDDASRGRSRSNASETPSTMMSGHTPYSRSISNLKGKNKEQRGSTADASPFDGHYDSSIYPLLYPYPIPTTSNEPLGIASPGPSESRPRPRNSKASFSLPTSSRNGKRLSANKHDLDDNSRVAYEYNRINPPAYLSVKSGSESADLINSRYFANEFVLPLFTDREVISEWKENVASGSLGLEEALIPDDLMDAQRWNGLVYDRAGKAKVEETKSPLMAGGDDQDGTAAPEMTLEVKKEETYGLDGPDVVSSIKPDTAESADTEKAKAADEAMNDSPSQGQLVETDGPVDQEEAVAEMDIDTRLLGDEGDGLEPVAATRAPQSAGSGVEGSSQKSIIEVRPLGASVAPPPIIFPVLDTVTVAETNVRPTGTNPPSQIQSTGQRLPGSTIEYNNAPFDEGEIEPNFGDEPVPRTIDFITPKPWVPASPSQAVMPPKITEPSRRMSSGRHQLADLLNDGSTMPSRPSEPLGMSNPLVRSPPAPPASMMFMLNSSNNGSGLDRTPSTPAPFTRTALGNMEIPAFRGPPSWPPPPAPMGYFGRPQLSPQANVNLQGRNITAQGFHLIPAMPNHHHPAIPNHPHPAHFAYAGAPVSYTSRRAPDYPPRPTSRSPTPPRMSTGPVEVPPDMILELHPFRPIPIQMASPFLDEAQEDVTEADTEVETPATPPRPQKGNSRKKVVESPVEITKPDLMPSSSRSNSISSPDRPSRITKAQSKRGRGRSTGSSRTREGSSVKLSSQSTPSVAPRPKSPAPTVVSARPQPKQKRKLSTVNEVFRGQDTTSKKLNTNKALVPSATPSSRNSISGPDCRTSSRMTSGIDLVDQQTAESEDELLLGPEGHQDFDDDPTPKRKTSSNTVDSQLYSNDGSSRVKETNYKRKANATSTPVGPAKATRSNDVAHGSTRRKTRNR